MLARPRSRSRSHRSRALGHLLAACLVSGSASAEVNSPGTANPRAAAEWGLVESKQPHDTRKGYRLYRRDVSDSKYDEYRIVALIAAPPEEVADATIVRMLDARFTRKGRARQVLSRSEQGFVTYLRFEAPFVDDRELIARTSRSYDSDRDLHRIQWDTVDAAVPRSQGVVRIETSYGSWNFHRSETNQTRAVYQQYTDLGGSIPGWIVRSQMARQQLDELAKLREILGSRDWPELRLAVLSAEGAAVPPVATSPPTLEP